MYNKKDFKKFNNKKLLHKIGKQWVIISLSLFMMLGTGFLITHTHANANNINTTVNNEKELNNISSRAKNLHDRIYLNNIHAKQSEVNSPLHTMRLGSRSSSLREMNYKTNRVHFITRSHNPSDNSGGVHGFIHPSDIELTRGNLTNKKTINNAINVSERNNEGSPVHASDYPVQSIEIDNPVSTKKATNLKGLFNLSILNYNLTVRLGRGFNTKKAYHHDGTKNIMYGTTNDDGVSQLTITSPNTIFNKNFIKDKDIWTNAKTGKTAHLGNGKPHVGTWVYGNSYNGLEYKFNPRKNSIEFTKGVMSYTKSQTPYEDTNGDVISDTFINDGNIDTNFLDNAPDIIKNAKTIKFDNGVNLSKISDMSNMFSHDANLRSLILSRSFGSNKASSMDGMFSHDINLKKLILPENFGTNKVNDMIGMFSDDTSLKKLVLPKSFNTSKVSDMSDMFLHDTNLRSLVLPENFDTSKVSDMLNMFSHDTNLKKLILPKNFNTKPSINSKLYGDEVTTYTYNMFRNVPLKYLSISSPNTIFFHDSKLKYQWKNVNTHHLANLVDGKSHVGKWTTIGSGHYHAKKHKSIKKRINRRKHYRRRK